MVVESSEDLFEFEVEQYAFLTDFGYRMTRRPGEIQFSSKELILTISEQRWGDPATSTLKELDSGQELPSPWTALQYFLDDYTAEWTEALAAFDHLSSLRASIAAIAALCKKNTWIFESVAWARDPQFARAIEETQRWFCSSSPPPSAAQVLAKLRSFRE